MATSVNQFSSSPTKLNGHAKPASQNEPSFARIVEELSKPPPQSLTLTALLQLLEPFEESQPDVFLMTRSYIQNWIIWAFHQKVTTNETNRVEEACHLAAERLGLMVPYRGLNYENPGPIDSSILAMEGHDLLLRPNIMVKDGTTGSAVQVPSMLRRAKSLPDEGEKKADDEDCPEHDTLDMEGSTLLCCAVPQQFYETLRSVHGVLCNDSMAISFQPFPRDSEALLHHHIHPSVAVEYSAFVNGIGNDKSNPRPVEFRRRVLMKQAPRIEVNKLSDQTSPMTKLLLQEQNLHRPRLIPSVEIYPIKLNYTIAGEDGKVKPSSVGFFLVSRRVKVFDALQGLMKLATPQISSANRRLWSKRQNPGTKVSNDGYELIDLYALDGKLLKKDQDGVDPVPQLSINEWLKVYGDGDETKEIDIVIETRKTNENWPRESLEFANRLQVGDFVDAQDSAGKWYEAMVREVHEDTVRVHYFGWASRWDSTIRRRRNDKIIGSSIKIRPPMPLWTHCRRWREDISLGKVVEVRDTSSLVDRPKWYKGVVRRVGTADGTPEIITGGAELEIYNDPTDTDGTSPKKPLLLLKRTKQVLVEVEQERDGNLAFSGGSRAMDASETPQPEPPAVRWVNLYGEEICEASTHMRLEPTDVDLPVVTLQYEYDSSREPVQVMKSWNNMYGQGFMKESLVGMPPGPGSVGMHNLGNSCFLNSIIQCLNHIEPLSQFFLKGDYMQDLNRKNPLGSGGRVATAYAVLLKEIWSGKYSALAPRMLKQTVASFAPQFNNSYQHDSQEFCQFLMDGLHEDCNRVKEKPYVEEVEGFGMEDETAAIETWRKHLLRHDSIIVDNFQGMHRSHLICPSCGRESIKFDVYSTISVPLPEGKDAPKITRLEDCLEKFMEGEQLDDLNAWYCPSCKKHVCALKMLALWSAPDVLIFHLKRFQFNHCTVRNEVVRSKIDDTIVFPIDGLDMRKYILGPIDDDAPPIYKLFGVSEHMGATANSGHYTATARNSKDGRWFRYNDAHVGETTGDAAVTGGAYLLFYQRVRGTTRWAGMEKVMKEREINPHGGVETDQDGFTKVKTKKKKN